jgi:ABC-2 type transport system ATP-binding protein
MESIEINNLTKYYGKERGIIDVNLKIEEGEVFGFIGPNGAGKSTTIRTILNFIYPSSGSAKILGMDCVKDSKRIRKDIGYLPSEVNYYDDMKVIDLLRYSARFYKKDCNEKIKSLAQRLELDLDRNIEDLSFGNKKKVAIVQALLHSPKILILDEPTSGLDPLMQNEFFEILKEENKSGTTIFFSSHILSEVEKICDKVAIIKEGRILKVESIENLRKNKFKNIRIELLKPEDIDIKVPGIIQINRINKTLSILFNGNVKELLGTLSKIDFENIWIEEPTLEEIFMHYYRREEE